MSEPQRFGRRAFLQVVGGAVGASVLAHGRSRAMPGAPLPAKRSAELPATALTRGPKAHFFGYYEKCPWSADGRYIAAHEIGFCDRQPRPGEPVTIGGVDRDRFLPLDETVAWSWQQGAMLQWLGSSPDRTIIYNGLDDGRYVARIRNVETGQTRTLPRPIYAVSPDGRHAVSLDFDRLNRLRPGYGYMAIPERDKDVAAPENAGIDTIDVESGENRLLISLAWAASNAPDDRFRNAHHWFNHLQFSRSGRRFAFLHRWRDPEKTNRYTRLYTANLDGTDRRLVWDHDMVSHYDWLDDQTILAWTQTPRLGPHFYLKDILSGESRIIGDGILNVDGHCSFSPDRRWILNDTYPDRDRLQHLMLYRFPDGPRIDLGAFLEPPQFAGPFRCDLHPRWNRDGSQVCFDSTHEGQMRQLYVVDVSSITKP